MAYDKVVDSAVLDGYFSDIADAIRSKDGTQSTYTPAQMPQAIEDIPSGGMDENFAKLLAGTAVGDITITGVTDLSMTRISVGRGDGMNNKVTGLHFPDLVRWRHSNTNYANKSGGLVDIANASSSAGSARIAVLDIPECTYLYMGDPTGNPNNYYFGNLTTLNAPKLTGFSGSLRGCGLTVLNLPLLTTLSNVRNFLENATSLTELRMPKLSSGGMSNYYLLNCTSLRIADLGGTFSINSAFVGTATSLEALVLRYNGTCSLNTASELSNSPIASGTGYIYVPRDLVATYQAATNWSTYASQFRALEDYTDNGTVDGEFIMPT